MNENPLENKISTEGLNFNGMTAEEVALRTAQCDDVVEQIRKLQSKKMYYPAVQRDDKSIVIGSDHMDACKRALEERPNDRHLKHLFLDLQGTPLSLLDVARKEMNKEKKFENKG